MIASCVSPGSDARRSTTTQTSLAGNCFANESFFVSRSLSVDEDARRWEALVGAYISLPTDLPSNVSLSTGKTGLIEGSDGGRPAFALHLDSSERSFPNVFVLYADRPRCVIPGEFPDGIFVADGREVSWSLKGGWDVRVADGIRAIFPSGELFVELVLLWEQGYVPVEEGRFQTLKEWIPRFVQRELTLPR